MPTFAGHSIPQPEEHFLSTPYISSGQIGSYTEHLQTAAAQADEQPLRYLRAWEEIERALARVDRARQQGADWDNQEGQPVPFATAKRAKAVIGEAARRAEAMGKVWVTPAVSATPDGGIHFSWLLAGNRVTLTVFAPYRDTICVSKFRGEAPRRELVSDYGAVSRALQAFEATALTPTSTSRR